MWINGPFGVGKSTVAGLVVDRLPDWRLFDPEFVGYMLKAQLADQPFSDFQHWRAWRQLVGTSAAAVADETQQSLVIVQTVTNEDYWNEIERSLQGLSFDVVHVVIVCDRSALERRIEADEVESGARQWRLDHLAAFYEARQWLDQAATVTVDTTDLDPSEVADRVLAAVA